MGAYGPPVDQLLRIDEDLWDRRKDWHDYLGMGIGPEHVPDLLRMVVDPELNDADPDRPEGWAPIHAWRALGILRAEEAIPTLVGVVAAHHPDNPNDWVIEELPTVFAMIGPAAVFDLTALFEREDVHEYAREDAASILTEIAKRHPAERAGVVATLTRWVERAEWHDPSSNGFFVSNLITLEARESAGVIEQAYAGGFVDESICGPWYDVWHALKLEGEPPPRPERSYYGGPFSLPDDLPGPPSLPASRHTRQPTEVRSPDERKGRNKARQKLEKKVKGKGKGGKRR